MSDVWWCRDCQVPLLKNKCEACGDVSPKPFAKDIVPVFSEEMTLLRDTFKFKELPIKSVDCYLWNSGPNYYINGQKVATLRYLVTNNPELRINIPADFKLPKWDKKTADSYIDTLYNANRTTIDSLEYEAMEFVKSTHAEYPRHVVMVAMSGGKDSTAVSEIVRKALGKSELLHVMSDTTIEASDTYTYVEEFHKHNPKVPLVRLTPTMDFYEISRKIGPPSRLRRWCCTTHKANQMATIVSALRGSSPGVLTFDGVRSAESPRRATYERISTKHKIKGEVLGRPIQLWLSLHVWIYILVHRLEFNQGYRFGFRRVGCLPCPFNSQWSNYLTTLHYPEDDKRWRTFLYDHAVRVGHPNPEHFSIEGWETRAGGRGQNSESTHLSKEVCLVQDNTYTYTLLNWSDTILEFLKPFGNLNITYDDGLIMKGALASRNKLVANIKIVRPKKTLRIEFEQLTPQKMGLLVSRFERQLKKYQTCILCGSCNMNCIMSAINANGKYAIDEKKCTHCIQCVRAKCIALDSLSTPDKKTTWGTCNGTN